MFGEILFGIMFEILFPVWLITSFDPKNIDPTPIATVKKIKMKPIKKDENQTCCVQKDYASLFEKTSIEKLGDITIPEIAIVKVRIIELVQIPLYEELPFIISTILIVPGTDK